MKNWKFQAFISIVIFVVFGALGALMNDIDMGSHHTEPVPIVTPIQLHQWLTDSFIFYGVLGIAGYWGVIGLVHVYKRSGFHKWWIEPTAGKNPPK